MGQTVTPARGEPLAVVQRIRAEYIEMPGLSLTVAQAARFWGLSARTLERVLSSLVESGFLHRDKKGCYRHLPTSRAGRPAGDCQGSATSRRR